jgi:hypothetical protein
MSIKLTDAQLAMLAAASLRDDRCLTMPKNLRGSAAQKVFGKLSAEGFIKEIVAKAGMLVWRRDEAAGRSYSLKLTAAGLKASPAEGDSPRAVADANVTSTASKVAADSAVASVTISAARISAAVTSATIAATDTNPPRGGTKIADVLGLLRRSDGATLAEMIATTSWLPHTTRAALTGLRRRGYDVSIDRSDKGRGSIYRVARDANHGDTGTDAGISVPGNAVSTPPRRSKRAGATSAARARNAA